MFENKNNLETVKEYKNIISLYCQFIRLNDNYLHAVPEPESFSLEYTLYMFIKSIAEYAKEACNCLEQGNFFAVSMLTRAIYENVIHLLVIGEHREESLWKYWLACSINNELKKYKKYPTSEFLAETLDNFCKSYKVNPELLQDKKFCTEYGWANIVFEGKITLRTLSDSINEDLYNDYKSLCDYSHGTSISQTYNRFDFNPSPLFIINCIFRYTVIAFEYYFDTIEKEYLELRANIQELIDAAHKSLNGFYNPPQNCK